MFWALVFGVALVGCAGHEFPRGGRIRFPYEGPPPPILDLFQSPRLYAAESQSHPIFHESSSNVDYSHAPFSANSQKPQIGKTFVDSTHYESGNSKPYINQHRSPPSRPREGQFHETQPPPFPTPVVIQGTKLKGILNAPPPPPPPTPSLSSLMESEFQRHRFSGHTSNGERPPSGQRYHGSDGRPISSPEKHNFHEQRHPGVVRDDQPNRHRPIHDRPPKGGERYQHQERYPSPSEEPSVYKEKVKVPLTGAKKPLFSPSYVNEKSAPKPPPRSPPPQSEDYSRPPTSDEDGDYYHSKLSEEYYSGLKNKKHVEAPVQTRAQSTKNPRPTAVKPQPGFDFNDMPFNFDMPAYGKAVDSGNPFTSGSMFPQSEEFGDFFDASLPDWMNDFKGAPVGKTPQGGNKGLKQNKQAAQETKRQQFKQPQSTEYFGEPHSYEQGNKYLSKRNPSQSKKTRNHFEDENDETQYHNKPKGNNNSNYRAQQDSYYDAPDSTEFDFGSSSPEYNMQDFNLGSFKFGSPMTKSTGTEWIPINAPDGAIPAKSYEIPAPDLSREQFRSQSQYDSGEYPGESASSRRQSSRGEKHGEHGVSNVVYGARNKRRQNEEVVSASVMVKQ